MWQTIHRRLRPSAIWPKGDFGRLIQAAVRQCLTRPASASSSFACLIVDVLEPVIPNPVWRILGLRVTGFARRLVASEVNYSACRSGARSSPLITR
jgi:hypothetical protein